MTPTLEVGSEESGVPETLIYGTMILGLHGGKGKHMKVKKQGKNIRDRREPRPGAFLL